MDRTYLEWNIVNWITVVLMASVGVLIIGALGAALKTYKVGGSVMTDPNAQG